MSSRRRPSALTARFQPISADARHCRSCARRSPTIIDRHQGVDVGPEQVIVTSGGTEALTASIMAVVKPGDEVLLFQPVYDAYLPIVLRAGECRGLPASPRPTGGLPRTLLAEAFTDRTRLVILNNPHNPTARAFGEDELAPARRRSACRHDAIALTDEVWEHVCLRRPAPHSARLASRHGRADGQGRLGRQDLLDDRLEGRLGDRAARARRLRSPRPTSSSPSPRRPTSRSAVAYGLGKDPAHFDAMRATFAEARDFLLAGIVPQGFDGDRRSKAPISSAIDLAASGVDVDDVTFCERAVREAGVAAIPLSAFYRGSGAARRPPLLRQETRDTGSGHRAARGGEKFVRALK